MVSKPADSQSKCLPKPPMGGVFQSPTLWVGTLTLRRHPDLSQGNCGAANRCLNHFAMPPQDLRCPLNLFLNTTTPASPELSRSKVEGWGTGVAETYKIHSLTPAHNLPVGMPNCGQIAIPEQSLPVHVPDHIPTGGGVPPEDVGHAIRVEITSLHNGQVSCGLRRS